VVGTEDAIRLGIVLAGILAAFAFTIGAETAQRHELTEHEEELSSDFFFVGVICLVAAITGVIYFVSIGRDADEQYLPALFFLYLLGGIAYFVLSVRLLILASINTRHVHSRLTQSVNFLVVGIVVAVLASILG
jgi:uncharacterized membrane protein